MSITALLLLAAGFAQTPPSITYQSKIPNKQRVEAIGKIQQYLKLAGRTDMRARAAAVLLDEAYIVEPLGADPQGGDMFRVIAPAKHKGAKMFGVVAIYTEDAKASPLMREFVTSKSHSVAGVYPYSPVVLLRVDKIDMKKNLKAIMVVLETRGEQVGTTVPRSSLH